MFEKKTKIGLVTKLVGLYFVLMPLDAVDLFGLGSILKLIAFFPIIAIVFIYKKNKVFLNKTVKNLLVYTIVISISCLYSIRFSDSISHMIRLIINVALVIFIGGVYDDYSELEYRFLIKSLVIGGILNVVLTFLFADTYGSSGRLTINMAGSRQDQNYLNGYSILAIAYFLNKLINQRKLEAVIPIFINFVFILMTGSRGALISLAVITCVTIIYTFFVNHNIKTSTVVITITLISVVSIYFEDILMLISPNVARRFSIEYIMNYRGLNRSDLWIHLISVYKDSSILRKIFGYGIGTVPYVNSLTYQVAHNLWLENLMTNGIIGLILTLVMQASYIKDAYKTKDIVLISAYFGFLTMCFTLSLTSYKPMWNVMIMIMIKTKICNKKKS